MGKRHFTSESVTNGHPDKVCDQIADAILDEILRQDPEAHVACEVTCATDQVHIFGEITADAQVDYEGVARQVIRGIGYLEPNQGFDADSCRIDVSLHTQSPDIARGFLRAHALDAGAGDQGMMFGYACRQTGSLMPLPIELAHALCKRLELVRRQNVLPYLKPDGKAQVTVTYEDDRPIGIAAVVVSAQHRKDVDVRDLRQDILTNVIAPVLPQEMLSGDTRFFINPTGRFCEGGPSADAGLTGRKLMVDTYGGYARHGGGAFSGKDASKVDRSGAYMARHLAKNLVAGGLADRCEVQLSYAIGVAEPTSVQVDTFGTGACPDSELSRLICEKVDLRPTAIIRRFALTEPIFSQVSCYGHFGQNALDMPWEETGLVSLFRS